MNTNHIQPLKKIYTINPLEKVANQTKSAPILVMAGFILLLLLIFILRLLYNEGRLFNYTGLNQSESSVINEILISLSIVFAVFFILVLFFPGIKEFGGFLTGISSSFVCIFYTFFLLYCLYKIPTNTMTKYASTLVPFFLFLTLFIFSGSLFTSFMSSSKNPMYDQINTMVLFFCFITTAILFYAVDPGNYISSNFGYLSLISMLIGIFGFVYLLILFIVPSQSQNTKSIIDSIQLNTTNMIGAAIFIIFSLLIGFGISQYPGGFFSEENLWPSLTITLLLSLVFSIISIFFIFASSSSTTSSTNSFINDPKMGLFKTSLLTVFYLVISALIITWLVIGIEGFTKKSGILSFILNVFLVIILLTFIYKSLNPVVPGTNSRRDHGGSLLFKMLFYIPCLFSNGLDTVTQIFTDKDSFDKYSSAILILLFIVLFYSLTNIQKTIDSSPIINGNLRNGTVLLLNPIPLNVNKAIGSYEDLNKYTPSTSVKYNYQYAISFWFFIQAEPGQGIYNQYKSLMNYGNKPDVLYRLSDNTLLVTMERNGLREVDFTENQDSVPLEKMDEYENDGIYENSRILYKRKKMQLQRWNHILLNYVNGTLDIFYNGKLVKTAVGLVPYMSLDSLTIGDDNGIQGNISNVIYYNKALTLDNIHTIYESVKNKNPPI